MPAAQTIYLIPDDSKTVVHVNATDLYIGKAKVGPVWKASGYIPLNASCTPVPSVGPFGTDAGTQANQFTLPPYSPLAFGDVDFSITVIVSRQPDNGAALFEPQILLNYQAGDPNGVQLYLLDGIDPIRTVVSFDGVPNYVEDDPYPLALQLPNPSVISAGYHAASQTLYLKVNDRATVTAPLGGPNNAPTTGCQLGNYINDDYYNPPFPNLPLPGQIFEVLASTNTPSEAAFTSIYNAVQANLATFSLIPNPYSTT